jgi:CheY-like chemotaxis protein
MAQSQNILLTTCHYVDEAKRLIAEQVFDAVICDLILPRTEPDSKTGLVRIGTGLEFIEHLCDPSRHGATTPDVFLCVVTAVHTPETKAAVCRFLKSEKHYLQKPILEPSGFLALLDDIAKHKARRA